jgi:2,3-bisphosphoglycerate-dependent phosphoglycerate mutase
VSRVVCLVTRHARYEQPLGVVGAHIPYPLTEEGKAEARAAADRVQALAAAHRIKLDPVVDTSVLLRAYETAEILARALAQREGRTFTVREFEDLAERSVGSATNLSLNEIDAVLARDPRTEAAPAGWERDPHYRLPFPGAESLLQAGERVARHLRKAVDEVRAGGEAGDRMKIVVGHSGSLLHALVHLGALSLDAVRDLTPPYAYPVPVAPRDGSPGAWKLLDRTWFARG